MGAAPAASWRPPTSTSPTCGPPRCLNASRTCFSLPCLALAHTTGHSARQDPSFSYRSHWSTWPLPSAATAKAASHDGLARQGIRRRRPGFSGRAPRCGCRGIRQPAEASHVSAGGILPAVVRRALHQERPGRVPDQLGDHRRACRPSRRVRLAAASHHLAWPRRHRPLVDRSRADHGRKPANRVSDRGLSSGAPVRRVGLRLRRRPQPERIHHRLHGRRVLRRDA